MRLEVTKDGVRAAEAERAFVAAVQQHLPPAAFEELEQVENPKRPDPAHLADWAARHDVDAPCVRRAAVGWCRGYLVDGIERPFSPVWNRALHEISKLPVQAGVREADENPLRPIVANPPHESHAEYRRRSERHWDASVKLAKGLGMTSETRTSGDFTRDLDWLVRFQIRGQNYREIVEAARIATNEDAVRQAIKSLARLLQLKLRRQARGRPRTHTRPTG